MHFDAIVLAGGASTRLGGVDKAALQVGGRTLLDRTLDAVAAARRIVVVGPDGISEQPPGGGPAAGVGAALDVLADDPDAAPLVAVLACDMPRIGAAFPVLLQALLSDTGAGVLAREGGRVQYLAGVHRAAALRAAAETHGPDLHGWSMRALLAGTDLREIEVPTGSTADVDTWDDAHETGVTR